MRDQMFAQANTGGTHIVLLRSIGENLPDNRYNNDEISLVRRAPPDKPRVPQPNSKRGCVMPKMTNQLFRCIFVGVDTVACQQMNDPQLAPACGERAALACHHLLDHVNQ